MARRAKRWTLGLATLLTVFFAAYTVMYFTWNDAAIARSVNGWAGGNLRGNGGPTHQALVLGRAHYPYWGTLKSLAFGGATWIEVSDTHIYDIDGNEVMSVPFLRTRMYLGETVWSKLFSLLGEPDVELHFADAEIPSARCHIATDSSGGVNLPDAFSAKVPKPSSGGMRIRVDGAVVGDVEFSLAMAGWHAEIHHLAAAAHLRASTYPAEGTADGPLFTYEVNPLRASSATLTLAETLAVGARAPLTSPSVNGSKPPPYVFPIEDLVATRFGAFPDKPDDLAFHATARTLGAPLTVDGSVIGCYGKHVGVDLGIAFDHGAGLITLLPTGDLLAGQPSGDVRIHGPFSDIVIDGHAEGAEVRIAGLFGRAARSHFALHGNLLDLTEASANVADGRVLGALQLDFSRGTWMGDLASERVDPSGLGPLLPPPARKLFAGRLGGHAHVEGSFLIHPERIKVRDLDMLLSRRVGRGDSVPRELMFRGALRFAPERVHLDGVSVSGDGISASARGQLDPVHVTAAADVVIDARNPGALLRLFGLRDVGVFGLHGTAHVTGPLIEPEIEGNVKAGRITYLGREVPGAEARLRFDHGTLDVEDLSAHGPLGGLLTGDLTLSLFDGRFDRMRREQPIKAHLETRGISIPALTGVATITGMLKGQLHLGGTLQHLSGGADIDVPEMKIFDDPYKTGQLYVDLKDGALSVRKLFLQRENGGYVDQEIGKHGTIGSDGTVDLDVVSKDFPLSAIPQLRNLPVALGGTLSGAAHIAGDIHRWTPSGVIEAAAIKVREVLLGDGRLNLVPGGDAIHLSGDFFDRFKIEGYLTLYPRIACNVTISFADFPLEQLIPELKKIADLHGIASGRADISFDATQGLTRAELQLDKVLLTLVGDEENDDSGTRHTDEFRNDKDEPVIITTDGSTLHFKQARLRSRIGKFEVTGELSATASNLRVNGQIELGLLEYFFSSVFAHIHGDAEADLTITGPAAKPEVNGSLVLKGAELEPIGAERSFTVPTGTVKFAKNRVSLEHLKAELDGAQAEANGSLELNDWKPGELALSVQGTLSPTLLAWIFPENIADPKGMLAVSAKMSGRWPQPSWSGVITVKELDFHEKRLGRDVHVSSGTVILDNYDFALGCPKKDRPENCQPIVALIDETGEIKVDGRIGLQGFELGRVDVHLDGRDLRWSGSSYTLSLSPHVDLVGDGDRLALRGDIDIISGRYLQDFEYANLVFKPHFAESEEPFYRGYPLIENLALAVTANSSGPLSIKNNIADLTVTLSGLAIGGTLTDPTFDGVILVEQDGRFTIPFLRTEFKTDGNSIISFQGSKKFPEQTPSLNLIASSDFTDRYENIHHLELTVKGTYFEPDIDLRSTDGWDKSKVLEALATGATSDELRKSLGGDPGGVSKGGSADPLLKQLSGQVLGVVEDPLKKVLRLDLARIELGSDSILVKLCPWSTRAAKLCGTGDVGFSTTARYSAAGELKLTDELSFIGSLEHIEHGLDTSEDIVNRFRLQLQLKIPLH